MIALEGISKVYRRFGGRAGPAALSDFSLAVERGEVVGIAGPNGAGKSTMISLILGYLAPSQGRVRIDGFSPRDYIERHGVGYLTELVAIPPRWTVTGALRRYSTLAGREAVPAGRIEETVRLAGLEEHRDKTVKQLSKGTLQRLGLALALLADRDLIILDEPTHGLDPLWSQRFRDIVQGLRRPGRAVLIASHNLDELERVADRVAIIHQGRLQRMEVVGAGEAASVYRLILAAGGELVRAVFPDAADVAGRPNEFQLRGDLAALNAGLARLLAAGARIAGFQPEESGLERAFRDAVGEESR